MPALQHAPAKRPGFFVIISHFLSFNSLYIKELLTFYPHAAILSVVGSARYRGKPHTRGDKA